MSPERHVAVLVVTDQYRRIAFVIPDKKMRDSAREKFLQAYNEFPSWIRAKLKVDNKSKIETENKNLILFLPSTGGLKGRTMDLIYIDPSLYETMLTDYLFHPADVLKYKP